MPVTTRSSAKSESLKTEAPNTTAKTTLKRWNMSDYVAWVERGCPEEQVLSINLSASIIFKSCEIVPETVNLKIKTLYLDSNQLKNVPSVVWTLTTLKSLHLSSNNLTNISDEIRGLVNLESLYLSHNRLTSIPAEIRGLVNLKYLDIGDNKLSALPVELGELTNIQTIRTINNNIQTIPAEIGNLQLLEYLYISGNPIEFLPQNIRNILTGQFKAQRIYNDTQSVHNHTIQQSIKASITRLISIKPTLNSESVIAEIIDDTVLTKETKDLLIQYSESESLIIEMNLCFLDVLTAVWNRIVVNENATEIKSVLNSEMKDTECKCFTGKISRLVNCLSGIDELVEIKISENEQIGNVISTVRNNLESVNQYSAELHKSLATTALRELGYTEQVIDMWTKYIQ